MFPCSTDYTALAKTVRLSHTCLATCAQVRIIRIFNTYGPRMALDDGRVVSNFVAQVSVIWLRACMLCFRNRTESGPWLLGQFFILSWQI